MPDPGVTRAKPPRKDLRQSIRAWEDLVAEAQRIKARMDAIPPSERATNAALLEEYEALKRDLKAVVSQRERERDEVIAIVKERPRLADEAIAWGFKAELLNEGPYAGSTDPDRQDRAGGTGGGGGGGGGTGTGGGGAGGGGAGGGGGGRGGGGGGDNIDHLPGKLGVDYHFVKGPSGRVHVVLNMDIPGPKKGAISFSVPKELYDRYGIDPDKVKQLTAAQMKKLKGFGPINEIKLRRGEHPFQSWLRQMKQKFGMAPSMLRDKEVMQVLYAAHLGQWDQAQLLGSLQQTKWYDTKTKDRIDWLFKMGSADKKQTINAGVNGLLDYVRQTFGGVDWTEHGLDQAKLKQWATNIASGKTGWDITEAKSRIDEIARGIEGTPLWASEEQAAEGALLEAQEWEDIFESYRSKNIQWLGPNGRSSREVITDWAKRRASGEKSDGDYAEFLREQRENLYPYITGNRSWQEFADPYKAALQRVMGDNASIDWNHRLLADLGAKDNTGAPTGTALSFYDFSLLARDSEKNPAAYQRGTALYDQGADRLAKVLQQLKGV